MLKLIYSIVLLGVLMSFANDGEAITEKHTFSRETSVEIQINAPSNIIWDLLTNAKDFTKWNTTIISIEGEISPDEKIKLKSTLDSSRVFKLRIKEFKPDSLLAWGDGKGTRVYTIKQKAANKSLFRMHEKIGGLMFPLYSSYIPDFDESFEDFARDLKKEAERIYNNKNQ